MTRAPDSPGLPGTETVPRHPAAAPTGLRFGYGSNGLADNRLGEALELLADLGYDGVSLTLDHQHLDPFDADLARKVEAVAGSLERTGLSVVVETGARYLLHPRRKHHPTLVSAEGRDRRLDLLERAVRIARDLGGDLVHLWSGIAPPQVDQEQAWGWLLDGCHALLETAHAARVRLAFEPEPGMLVGDLAGFERLHEQLGSPADLGVMLDIGHCQCLEDTPVAACVRRAAPHLRGVQIEDMRRGVHEHLPFGEGEIDFPPVLAALLEAGYQGLVSVELPRHSWDGPESAKRSLRFLRSALAQAQEEVLL